MACLSVRVLDLPALELRHCLADVGGHGSGLGIGHETAGAQHSTEATHDGHEVGGGNGDVEVQHPALHLLGEIFGSDEFRTGFFGLLGCLAHGEHGDADILARTRRERDGAPDHLVGLAGVDPQSNRSVDRLVERPGRAALDQVDRLFGAVDAVSIEALRAASSYFLEFAMMAPSFCVRRGEVVRRRWVVGT